MLFYLFVVISICTLFLITALLVPLPTAPNLGVGGTFVIENVNIVDVELGEIIESATVMFNDEGILAIQEQPLTSQPPGSTRIDGRNLYLIPGLWDMHTHSLKLSPQLHHPLFIRYGITSVRDMSGCLNQYDSYWACPEDRSEWNQASAAGNTTSPRYIQQSSYQTNGGNEVPAGFPSYFRLESISDARQLSGFYAEQGVEFIKTYSELSANQFDMLSVAAKEKGLFLAGHKPITVPLLEAVNVKMASIEHGRLFMFECYQFIDTLRQTDNFFSLYTSQKIREIIDHQDNELCKNLMQVMAESETYWVPTLTTLKMSAMSRDPEFRQDIRLSEIPFIVRSLMWDPDINRAAETGFDDSGVFIHEDYFDMASNQVEAASAYGVKILAGTDNIDTYVFTGSSLHDELSMLVEAGLSPLEALQSATINAAQFANQEEEVGSVQVGKEADMILLKGNPLIDIENTQRIAGVVFDGRYFDESALGQLEEYSINMAQSFRVNLHYLVDLLMSPLMRVQLAD